jgi:hypothetical protein
MALVIHPTACTIDSRLGNLADSFELSVVERDTDAPVAPVAAAWRTLDQGDLVRIRLGLRDQGLVDYGTFRVDESALEATESSWLTRLHGRDQAALLVEERAQLEYGYGTFPSDDPAEPTHPSARTLAGAIAARVGLDLIWDAPSYSLTSFTLQPEESASQALGRLLEPLRASRRYATDAWVEDGHLVVRRRGNGPNIGTIDCSLGQTHNITRARQPRTGHVHVYGATYVQSTEYERDVRQSSAGAGNTGQAEPQASVRTVEQSPTHRVVETGIVQGNGEFAVISRETEDVAYIEVSADDGSWLGRVLTRSEVLEEKDLHTASPKRARRITAFGYDEQWRLVLRDERVSEYQSDGTIKKAGHTLTRFEQVTPTDVRTVTTEFKVAPDGTETVKSGYPKWEQAPGTLQSSVRQRPDAEGAWGEEPDHSQPVTVRKTEVTAQYEGIADGGGTIERVYRNDSLQGTSICHQIAEDLAAESGRWLYVVELFWPRPFVYRKGQKVTLAGLPGGCPDLIDALIAAVRTRYDEEAAVWSHDVSFECWRDT